MESPRGEPQGEPQWKSSEEPPASCAIDCPIAILASGVLSIAVEAARHADNGGEGCGASPDVLRLTCDAFTQTLIAMQAEEAEAAAAATAVAAAATATAGPSAATALTTTADSALITATDSAAPAVAVAVAPAAARWAFEDAAASGRSMRRSRHASHALESAAAAAGKLPTARRPTRLMTYARHALGGGPIGHTDGSGDGSGGYGDGDGAETRRVVVGASELRMYSRCVSTLWSYISARLPTLIAEHDEAADSDGAAGDGGEEAACAELLIHLLSLSHRLSPMATRAVAGDDDSSGGADADADADAYAADGSVAESFVWQLGLCPPSLVASARAALRAAATMVCAQELRAALQTRRPTTSGPTRAAAVAAGQSYRSSSGVGGGALRCTADVAGSGASGDCTGGAESGWAGECWVQLVRLRRVRERLRRVLPTHLALLATVTGGAAAVVAVWGEVLWATVLEPLRDLCVSMPVRAATAEVLCICLEHRRIEAVISSTRRATAAFSPPPGAEAGSVDDARGESSGKVDDDDDSGSSEEVAAISDRAFYSPFVYCWLEQASAAIARWQADSLRVEDWSPIDSRRRSRTLALLGTSCLTLVCSLQRLGIHTSGEVVAAAQCTADLFALFLTGLATAAADVVTIAPAAGGGGGGGGGVGAAAEAWRQSRPAAAACTHAKLAEARSLLTLLRIEPTTLTDDPLDSIDGGGGGSGGDGGSGGGGGGGGSGGGGSGAVGGHSSGSVLDSVGSLEAVDAVRLPLLDEVLRAAFEGDAARAEEEDDDDDDAKGGAEGGTVDAPLAAGGATDALAGVGAHELSRRCRVVSNALAAREQIEATASQLEALLNDTAEQRSIVSACYTDLFARLRQLADAQIVQLVERLRIPVSRSIEALGPQLGPRRQPSVHDTAQSRAQSHAQAPLAALVRSCTGAIGRLRRLLAHDVMRRLLQRVWTDALAAVAAALVQHLFVPRELGAPFASGALGVLATLAPIVYCDGVGPSREWLRRRAGPLEATLILAVEASSAALVQQCRIQPVGPRRAAPLAALALRMDDRDAAEFLSACEPAELAVEDGAKALAVDGVASLEAIGRMQMREASASTEGCLP